MMEFHISRKSRDRYQFSSTLYSINGNVIFGDFHAAQIFSEKMNAHRDLVRYPDQALRAGQINAMGLIDEILHFVIDKYRQQNSSQVFLKAIDHLNQKFGKEVIQQLLTQFCSEFPPLAVYLSEQSLNQFLSGETALSSGVSSNLAISLEEMLMLWLANENPAFLPYQELFEDNHLAQNTVYLSVIDELRRFFNEQPAFGPEDQNLVDMLRSPAVAHPFSLSAQLAYIRSRWGYLLGELNLRILLATDFIKEEEKITFTGPGKALVYEFSGLEQEDERFSPDQDWMPNLVLIAKNSYVWLDQLSKKYQVPIQHLDQIPDEELDLLARSGFSGLWLIGLWERSPASKRIKQMRGNPEAEASAYSIFDYQIASDLGGEQAFQNLRHRAWLRGIRLSSDMVPNHMGIDSPWVIEHPDWFIALDQTPFPSYTFNGSNLSWDTRVGIYLEDHYFNNTDAAVVFKRVDFGTGQEKYIYHGNDGTSMPWNDTAQLNYLKSEVREAVIQTILQVARRFPIIRFDAAMTLAKRHYQRLWFPEPGGGGDIPSRAAFGLSKEEFNRLFPVEFWREVVDRVASEVPDTLLLAEAFWLMEGYFVRTLGMHRVYNSAFMNMLRDEKNQEYRQVIKNTLEFDPEILKRYVNFMNNPDEKTAVDQYGKGDKYFGICMLLATMPGLPMFGHGQIEGFTEKYGMEYRHAYWNETADRDLVDRHQREIFPLLRKRYLFAGLTNFLLYDFYQQNGHVNENVFAYSNRVDGESALVIYHNRFTQTRGWIRNSAAFNVKSSQAEKRGLIQKTLAEGLGIENRADFYTIFRDHVMGNEYLRSSQEIHEKGLYLKLEAYQHHVFLDFRQVKDNEKGHYYQLNKNLAGRGVPDLATALHEMVLEPILRSFKEIINPGQLQWLVDHRIVAGQETAVWQVELEPVLEELEGKVVHLLDQVKQMTGSQQDERTLGREIHQNIFDLLALPAADTSQTLGQLPIKNLVRETLGSENAIQDGIPQFWGVALTWLLLRHLGKFNSNEVQAGNWKSQTVRWLEEWGLDHLISRVFVSLGIGQQKAGQAVNMVKLLTLQDDWFLFKLYADELKVAAEAVQAWLGDSRIREAIDVNLYQGTLWFNKEKLEYYTTWMFLAAFIEQWFDNRQLPNLQHLGNTIQHLIKAQSHSGYQVTKLIQGLQEQS